MLEGDHSHVSTSAKLYVGTKSASTYHNHNLTHHIPYASLTTHIPPSLTTAITYNHSHHSHHHSQHQPPPTNHPRRRETTISRYIQHPAPCHEATIPKNLIFDSSAVGVSPYDWTAMDPQHPQLTSLPSRLLAQV